MERIVILDHDRHCLYIEDVLDEILDAHEWDGEENYIKENYSVNNFSWDYIVDTEYFPEGESVPIEINFEEL